MILEKGNLIYQINQYVHNGSSKMQTTLLAEFFAFLNVYQRKTQLIKALNSLHSSRSYGRTGASTELFLAENDFKTSSTVNFPKKDLETNQRHEPQAT